MTQRDRVDDMLATWRAEIPEAAGLPFELGKRVARLAELFGAATESVLADHGFTRIEYAVLANLRAAGAPYRLKPAALSRALIVTTGGLSNIVTRLRTAGLVTRESDPADARSTWVRLTDAGVPVADTLIDAVTKAQGRLTRPLPDETARQLADLLREVLIDMEGPAPRPADLRGGPER
ncbi:MarR family winged helix-turn-helix transcriptional regulator [Stackebrandtia nassauensis]|uniref:Transcriptional regulator, MarR family n=1 Tax=Stackebrandtia nassauensis (strain DSM 44728 / CIP 108903 / NRRL B-16338 / NBRC 102104 / LLR-40K-21) TaxID=446470 RepID=D3PXT1_STANL|nr:MarR family transcriptional regulator [Stackebrandtia nassauensis]ADD43411.1 transcriptional regulator, MarR family [Stackebrandtia nassauensis DSM 44728]